MSVTDVQSTAAEPILADIRAAFADGRTRDARWRIEQLRAIERMCEEQEAEIAAALAADLGRTSAEAWMGDVAPTKAEAVFARNNVRKWMRRKRTSLPMWQRPARAWVQYCRSSSFVANGDGSTWRFAKFSSKWRMRFSHLRGES